MIPPSGYLRRVIFTFALVTVPLMIGLLFTYDVIKIYWNPGMVFQIDNESALKWLLDGAKPTKMARDLLSKAGVMVAWDAAKRAGATGGEKPEAAKAEA